MITENVKEMKRWLQDCDEMNDKLLSFSHKHSIEKAIKEAFPILKPYDLECFFAMEDSRFGLDYEIQHSQLRLGIALNEEDKYNKEQIANLFSEEFSYVAEFHDGELIIMLSVKDIVKYINNTQIRKLREECESIAQPYLEARENEVLAAYEEQCLEEDPFYLGVRFVSFDGEYPTRCTGNVILEIEGIPWKFPLQKVAGGMYIDDNTDIDVPPEYVRYTNEIRRVLMENITQRCCYGCE